MNQNFEEKFSDFHDAAANLFLSATLIVSLGVFGLVFFNDHQPLIIQSRDTLAAFVFSLVPENFNYNVSQSDFNYQSAFYNYSYQYETEDLETLVTLTLKNLKDLQKSLEVIK